MINVLIVSTNKEAFSDFTAAFQTHGDVQTTWAESGARALATIGEKTFGLVIADETLEDMTGLEFARKVVAANPFVNCALTSGLSDHDFHEATEGLGILMQLPLSPGAEHAEQLREHFKKIRNLIAGS